MVDWPLSLPVARVGTIKERRVPSYVDDKPEVGKPRRRKRYTRTLRKFSFVISIDDSEKATLNTFIDTTTDGGVEQFYWTHPTTAAVHVVRFAVIPDIDDVTIGLWDVQVALVEV